MCSSGLNTWRHKSRPVATSHLDCDREKRQRKHAKAGYKEGVDQHDHLQAHLLKGKMTSQILNPCISTCPEPFESKAIHPDIWKTRPLMKGFQHASWKLHKHQHMTKLLLSDNMLSSWLHIASLLCVLVFMAKSLQCPWWDVLPSMCTLNNVRNFVRSETRHLPTKELAGLGIQLWKRSKTSSQTE